MHYLSAPEVLSFGQVTSMRTLRSLSWFLTGQSFWSLRSPPCRRPPAIRQRIERRTPWPWPDHGYHQRRSDCW